MTWLPSPHQLYIYSLPMWNTQSATTISSSRLPNPKNNVVAMTTSLLSPITEYSRIQLCESECSVQSLPQRERKAIRHPRHMFSSKIDPECHVWCMRTSNRDVVNCTTSKKRNKSTDNTGEQTKEKNVVNPTTSSNLKLKTCIYTIYI